MSGGANWNRHQLFQPQGGVTSDLAADTAATTSPDTWYNVRVLLDGPNCTIWRGVDDGGMEEVLTANTATVGSTIRLYFFSAANSSFRYDDIQAIGSSLANTATTFACNDANELTGMTRGGVTTSFAYDAWGRMSGKTRGGYGATYAWGQGHKLTGVTSTFPGEGNVTYAYGGDGKRRERNDGAITQYNWDAGWNVVNEENGAGTLTSTLLVGLADFPGPNPATGAPRYYLTDHLGSLRALHATDKSQLGVNEYTAYGEEYLQLSPVAIAYQRFARQEWDPCAALYFAPYRYYDPISGRWVSKDPLGMIDGPNMYGYVKSRPVSYVDISGGWLVPALIALGAWVAVCKYVGIEKGKQAFPNDDKKRHCFTSCWYNRCTAMYAPGTLGGGLIWEIVEGQIFTDPAESIRDLKADFYGVCSSYSFDSCKNKCRKCPDFKG